MPPESLEILKIIHRYVEGAAIGAGFLIGADAQLAADIERLFTVGIQRLPAAVEAETVDPHHFRATIPLNHNAALTGRKLHPHHGGPDHFDRCKRFGAAEGLGVAIALAELSRTGIEAKNAVGRSGRKITKDQICRFCHGHGLADINPGFRRFRGSKRRGSRSESGGEKNSQNAAVLFLFCFLS